MLSSSQPAFKSVPHAKFKSASRGERVNTMIRVVRMITINKFVVLRKNLIRCIIYGKKRKHTDWTQRQIRGAGQTTSKWGASRRSEIGPQRGERVAKQGEKGRSTAVVGARRRKKGVGK